MNVILKNYITGFKLGEIYFQEFLNKFNYRISNGLIFFGDNPRIKTSMIEVLSDMLNISEYKSRYNWVFNKELFDHNLMNKIISLTFDERSELLRLVFGMYRIEPNPVCEFVIVVSLMCGSINHEILKDVYDHGSIVDKLILLYSAS